MNAPVDLEALKRRLIETEPTLPRRLRQTAAFALEHPDEMALGTAASVAERARSTGVYTRALCADAWICRIFRSAERVSHASAQPLAGLFRAAEDAARNRARQKRSHALCSTASPNSAAQSIARIARRRDARGIRRRDRDSRRLPRRSIWRDRDVPSRSRYYLAYAFAQMGVRARR